MAKLKVPSLQHLARNSRGDPDQVKRILVALARGAPNFSYNPLFAAVRDRLVFGTPYAQLVEGIKRGVKREDVRENFLGVLPLIEKHFAEISPTFVQAVDRRYYPVGRGIMVPFDPPLIYGADGKIFFPWFSFWRSNPLARERLSLFVTLVDEVLLQDPDLESACFQILDFSAPDPKSDRELTVIEASEIPRIDAATKAEMLEAFAEAFLRAVDELSKMPEPPKDDRPTAGEEDDHPDLFDPKP